jgi:hypothetical protein
MLAMKNGLHQLNAIISSNALYDPPMSSVGHPINIAQKTHRKRRRKDGSSLVN